MAKKEKLPDARNFVAKNAGINKASVHKDKKKASKEVPTIEDTLEEIISEQLPAVWSEGDC